MGRLVACSARISVDTHTHRQNDYRNPRCACAPRVNYSQGSLFVCRDIAVFVEGYFLHYFLVCDTLAGTPPICLYMMFQGQEAF